MTANVHAPNELRVNIQVQNLDDFYKTYDIKEKDAMYRAPDKRVHIGNSKIHNLKGCGFLANESMLSFISSSHGQQCSCPRYR